jgi:hypothetical protein
MTDHQKSPTRSIGLRDILFMPFGCLITLSPWVVFALLFGTILAGFYVYFYVNVDLLGIGSPEFSNWNISSDYRTITNVDHSSWQIDYQFASDSTFSGIVRHISPLRLNFIPLLTHDILVTNGEFADPAITDTFVSDHHFTWKSKNARNPSGNINLLHTVPYNQEVYQKLLNIQNGDQVVISGREILQIRAYDPKGKLIGSWEDSGCNSILVKSVEIKSKREVNK